MVKELAKLVGSDILTGRAQEELPDFGCNTLSLHWAGLTADRALGQKVK